MKIDRTQASSPRLPEEKHTFFMNHAIRAESYNMPESHSHDSYEIYYMRSGERFYFIKDRSYHVRQGDLVLISPLLLHKTTEANSPSHERILINFKPSFIQPISDQFDVDLLGTFHGFPILRPDMKERPVIEALMEKLQKERRKKEPGAEGYLKLLLTELLLWIYRQAQASSEQPTGQEHPTALHRNVSDIVKFINEHYREKLQLHVIAEHFHISLYYLCHIFKEATGFTIIEYINQHRISEAQKLLKSTRLTVTTIAEEVGFDSSTHFGRVFKSVSGLSPLQYRKQATAQ